MSTAPDTELAGAITVTRVSVVDVIVPLTPPKETEVAYSRFVPFTCTLTPPFTGLAVGATEVMVGDS